MKICKSLRFKKYSWKNKLKVQKIKHFLKEILDVMINKCNKVIVIVPGHL